VQAFNAQENLGGVPEGGYFIEEKHKKKKKKKKKKASARWVHRI
jgi:hypothetical protein